MTSKQVMLTTIVLLATGCNGLFQTKTTKPLVSPYPTQRVWAVAPLRNESGSQQADGLSMADHFVRHLNNAAGLQVLPLNRTLAAMQSLDMSEVTEPADCQRLLRVLGVDGLVIGSITAYDPYDPPMLGLAVELWVDVSVEQADYRDVRELSRAATATETQTAFDRHRASQPDNTVADTLDASDPYVRQMLERYAAKRGAETGDDWRRYRISMDLYSEFAAYVMSWRLLDAEAQRIARLPDETPRTTAP